MPFTQADRVPALRQMRLWLTDERTQGWLAKRLGVSRPTVFRWFQGENSPNAKRRQQIHDLSQGLVHFDDWYTDAEMQEAYVFSGRALKRKWERRASLCQTT